MKSSTQKQVNPQKISEPLIGTPVCKTQICDHSYEYQVPSQTSNPGLGQSLCKLFPNVISEKTVMNEKQLRFDQYHHQKKTFFRKRVDNLNERSQATE